MRATPLQAISDFPHAPLSIGDKQPPVMRMRGTVSRRRRIGTFEYQPIVSQIPTVHSESADHADCKVIPEQLLPEINNIEFGASTASRRVEISRKAGDRWTPDGWFVGLWITTLSLRWG
jgi:hypothetical protein